MGIHYTCCQGHSRTYRGYGDIFIVYFLYMFTIRLRTKSQGPCGKKWNYNEFFSTIYELGRRREK